MRRGVVGALLCLALFSVSVARGQSPAPGSSTPKEREGVLDALVPHAELVRWRPGPIRVGLAPSAEPLRADLETIVGDYRSALAGTTCSIELLGPGLTGDIEVLAGNATQLRDARRTLNPSSPDMSSWYSWRRNPVTTKGGAPSGPFDTGAAGIHRGWVLYEEDAAKPSTPVIRFLRLQRLLGRVLLNVGSLKDGANDGDILGVSQPARKAHPEIRMLTDIDRRLIRFAYTVPPDPVTKKAEVRTLLRKHWDATRP